MNAEGLLFEGPPDPTMPLRQSCARCIKWVADPRCLDLGFRCQYEAGGSHLRCVRCAQLHHQCQPVSPLVVRFKWSATNQIDPAGL